MVEDEVVLKHDELFVVCDNNGDIRPAGPQGSGLYFRDMRHLSTFDLCLDGCTFDLLDKGADAIDHLVVYLTNENVLSTESPEGEAALPQTIAVTRRRELNTVLVERVTLTNYNPFPVALRVTTRLAADFRDLFDIRGIYFDRQTRPKLPQKHADGYCLSYESADGTRFMTIARATPTPTDYLIEASEGYTSELSHAVSVMPGNDRVVRAPADQPAPAVVMLHDLTLDAGASAMIEYLVEPCVVATDDSEERPRTLGSVAGGTLAEHWRAGIAHVVTTNEAFNRVLARSSSDMQALYTPLPDGGSIIAAGIPWFVAPFGRDSIIAARQLLPFYPGVADETLRYLASVQGDEDEPWRDEQPGKIIHEIRFGEMARRNLIPHMRYYGSVDSTPLFLLLAADYLDWTGDRALFDDLSANIDRALAWIDNYGDTNGDGFIDYATRSERGILNQNWKDSDNSLQRPDRLPIHGPIASVEAQGYVFAAKARLAEICARFGQAERAARLREEADRLRAAVERAFWLPELGYYAEALDGDGVAVATISSNPAHLLAAGLPDPARAGQVADWLNAPEMFSGWGVRTLSAEMPHYNPMSYHNGSVWPHDNGFALWGLRRYRRFDALDRLATALFGAAVRFPYHRLPELMCGFARGAGPSAAPIAYPVSCSPQAWAAGVPFVIIEALLGLRIDVERPGRPRVSLDPWLPDWLEGVDIYGLTVGEQRLDLRVRGRHDQVDVRVLSNPGRVSVALGA